MDRGITGQINAGIIERRAGGTLSECTTRTHPCVLFYNGWLKLLAAGRGGRMHRVREGIASTRETEREREERAESETIASTQAENYEKERSLYLRWERQEVLARTLSRGPFEFLMILPAFRANRRHRHIRGRDEREGRTKAGHTASTVHGGCYHPFYPERGGGERERRSGPACNNAVTMHKRCVSSIIT